jgi:hypothetical protein
MTSIMIRDETTSGRNNHEWTLEFLDETISAKEFIRRRIYEEVLEYNTKPLELYRGLVQPSDVTRELNGVKLQTKRQLNFEEQYAKALEGFENNGFVMLWNDTQVESLDQMLELKTGTQVTFLKLVPLIGG